MSGTPRMPDPTPDHRHMAVTSSALCEGCGRFIPSIDLEDAWPLCEQCHGLCDG